MGLLRRRSRGNEVHRVTAFYVGANIAPVDHMKKLPLYGALGVPADFTTSTFALTATATTVAPARPSLRC